MMPESEMTDEVKGMVACRGRARGKAKVMLSSFEIEKFKKGDVLVAPETTPSYLPIMTKAVAIVTDQGGITSHAAIVSRELGIPCIIGTKIATKTFKDGDLIEVDAEKGIVRKINKRQNNQR
jgi:pyruvate,water dikinase